MANSVNVIEAASTAAVTSDILPLQSGQLASVHTGSTVSVWMLDLASAATVGSTVLATQSGTGRWLLVAQFGASSSFGMGDYYGLGIDSSRTDNGGGAGTAITQPRDYTDWTISNATTIREAGYYCAVRGTLSLAASCIIHNDGFAGSDNATAGGTGAGMAGQIEFSHANGGSGGGATSPGAAGSNQTNALGGAGGKGGNSAAAVAGGAGGTATVPNTGSVGRFTYLQAKYLLNSNYTQPFGGSPGGGGAGGAANPGSGGGSGGGVVWIAAKNITLASGAKITANGGRGGNTSVGTGGGGGGGGGGVVFVFCDTMTKVDSYATHFTVDGGAAGTASGGGVAGVAGSAGRVFVFEGGILTYTSP